MKDNNELLPEKTQTQIIKPLVNPEEALKAFNEYQSLKRKLRGDGDFIEFVDSRGQKREAPTKQWRTKLTRFFGISVEIIKEEIEYLNDGSFIYKVTARAVAPNGLFMDGDGTCWSKTKERSGLGKDIYHLTRAHAITRAKNRAVLELVGFGEVSAEEIEEEENQKETSRETVSEVHQKDNVNQAKKEYWDKIWSMIREKGITNKEIMDFAGVKSLRDIPREKLEKFKEFLERVAFEIIDFTEIRKKLNKKFIDMSDEEIDMILHYEPKEEEINDESY
jgi:hypothetical protein